MHNSSFRACLFVIILMLLLLSPLAIHAAGLGKLTLNSALGQPLQAEIDIVTVNNDEISSLKVELASRDAFTQAGIRYESFFSTFNVSIEPRANGDPYVIITSPQAINEPFLNILVELSWASGRLLREYTVLLDPVEYDTPAPVAPTVQPAPAVIETVDDVPAQTPEVVDRVDDSATVAARGDTYGPVVRGDNLSDITRQVMPDGVNLNQMLVAMYRANHDAFIDNNMNLLRVGAILRIPDSSEITAIDVTEANAEVKIQVANWRNYREKLIEAAREAEPSEELRQADSGQITTTVAEDAAAVHEEPEEVLRLSSGVQMDAHGEEGADTSMMDRLRMTEEDAIAHSLALQEANERVAMLEKQVEDLQQLLELKQPDFAQAQLQAETILEQDIKPESESLEIITSSPESILDEEFNLTPEQETTEFSDSFTEETIQEEPVVFPEPIIEETIPEPVASPAPLPVEEEQSYLDLIMENVEYIVGALLVLLGALFIIKRRQKKSEEDADIDDMDFGDMSPSMRDKMAAVAAAGAAGTAASMDSDNLPTDDEEAMSEFDQASTPQTEETQEDDFEKGANFFQEEKNYAESTDDNLDFSIKSPQETGDASDDTITSDHEIDLDLEDTSQSQDDSIEFEETKEGDEQAELDAEAELSFEDEVTDDETSTTQPDDDHEIEFDLGDLITDKAESEQEDKIDSELTDTQVGLVEEAEETESPIESLAEPELAEPGTDEETNTEDQIDLMAAKLAESPEDLKDVAEALDYDLNIDSDETPAETQQTTTNAIQEDETDLNSIAFEPESSAIELPDDQSSNEIETSTVNEEDIAEIDIPDNVQSETDVEETQIDETSPALDANEPSPELSLADINLNIEDEATHEEESADKNIEQSEAIEDTSEAVVEPEVAAMPESTEKSEQWHEVETKMDLAKAYQEMDDKEGAREMFEEVMREGDKQQQEKAKALLDEL